MSSTSINDVNISYKVHKTVEAVGLEYVPDHWQVLSLRYVTRFAYGDALASDIREDGNFSVYGSNGAVGTHSRSNTESPALIIGRKGSFGKINYSTQAVFAIDTTYFVDVRQTKTNLRWLFYTLQCLGLDKISQDTGVPGLSREDAYGRYVALPPLPEQQAIAAFLDRETARLDALIARKERLLELLEEKRKAIISQAVTRGLDASVPMKDSSVEWLGQVPEGWTCESVTARYTVQLGKMLDQGADVQAHSISAPYLRNTNIQWDHIDTNDIYEMAFDRTEKAKFSLKYGDLLICEGGDVGRTAIWKEELQVCFFQKALHRLRKRSSRDDPRYFFYVMFTASHMGVFIADGNKSTIIHLTADKLKKHRMPFPPLSEQEAIAAYLDAQAAKLDALRQKMKQSVEKLSEYRTSLISAAVTGKIDVRGEIPD